MTDEVMAEVASWVYADMVDPRDLVEKMSPTGSEMHVSGDRKKERRLAATGLAATAVAGVGGVHAIKATTVENKARAAKAAEGTYKGGRFATVTHLSPKRAAAIAGAGWLGLHGVELTGDALATRAQVKNLRDNSGKKREKIAARAPVAKGMFRNLADLGEMGTWMKTAGAQQARATKTAADARTARRAAGAQKAGKFARNVVNELAKPAEAVKPKKTFLQRNFRPVAAGAAGLGVGAVAGANVTVGRRQKVSARLETPDLEWAGTISKVDTDKRLAFGWASLSKVNGEPYVDRQGDWIPVEETEKAAYDYVINARVGGDMHRRAGGNGFKGITKDFGPHKVADLVESFVVTPEKLEKMGLAPDALPEGWWIGMKVHDDDTWAAIKDGRRTGFSVHGTGIRKDVQL